MNDAAKLSITDRARLRDLNPQPGQVVPPGRAMFWKGRQCLGTLKLTDLGGIPRGADSVWLCPADYAVLMEDR